MNVAGVICEYNPFHTGHAYHLEQTRRMTGCDYVIAVMDGCFTQRGEPALFDKWVRTEMALRCGADVVIELPALFAIRSADWFARGGVNLLGALGVVDTLSFGCEIESLATLNKAADVLECESSDFKAALKTRLKEGMPFARARGEALCECLRLSKDIFHAPNTALALEYIRANRSLRRPMLLQVVKRTGHYHDKTLSAYSSATAIRHTLLTGNIESALTAVPEASASLIERHFPDHAAQFERLDNVLLHAVRGASDKQINELLDAPEGLGRRIRKMSASSTSRIDLLQRVKCKRYTLSRLSRLLTYTMLDMRDALSMRYTVPPYARVLGFRKDAKPLLKAIDEKCEVPLVADPMRLKENPCFHLETQVTDLWGLCTSDPYCRQAGRDYTEKMIKY